MLRLLYYFPFSDLAEYSILGLDFIICFQGLRPDLPKNAHPKLLDLMRRCWDAEPENRPPFTEIKVELENLLEEVQVYLLPLVFTTSCTIHNMIPF